MTNFVVGVSGASGSGKTTFVKEVVLQLGIENVCVLSMDNYYKPIEEQYRDVNGKENFDLPQAIDIQRFRNDFDKLKNGQTIEISEYTFNNPNKLVTKIKIIPKPIIIIEGVFVFHYEELKPVLDFKIYINVSDHKCIIRRLGRDLIERNYALEHTLYDFENHVWHGYEKYIKPYIQVADIVINNDNNMHKSIAMASVFLHSKL